MASEKELRIRLKDCNEQIGASIEQINAYNAQAHVLDKGKLEEVVLTLQTLDPISLRGVCENSANMIREIKLLAQKEIQRRGLEESLKGAQSRGAVKKNRPTWFDADSGDKDSSDAEDALRSYTKKYQ